MSTRTAAGFTDRKSTRLNSSHLVISYAVFCLKKKKNKQRHRNTIPTHISSHMHGHARRRLASQSHLQCVARCCSLRCSVFFFFFFFFNDTATTEIYTLSLHDALPIYVRVEQAEVIVNLGGGG